MGGEKTVKHDDPSDEYREKIMDFMNRVDEHLNVSQKVEATRQYASAHPMIAAVSVITLVLCSFPVMCFGAFVVGTMFFTFLSFLFVEGFLLTIGGVFLGSALVITGALSMFLSILVAVAFLTFHYGSKLMQSVLLKKRAIFSASRKGREKSDEEDTTAEDLMQQEE